MLNRQVKRQAASPRGWFFVGLDVGQDSLKW